MQNETVKGFKAMHSDMTCSDYQFSIGKTFRHDGPVVPCESGFHFCKKIEDIADYYTSNCRIFEVEASGVVVEEDNKTVTDTLTIIKEVDYNDYIDHPYWWVRSVVANKGIGLDTLIDDKDDLIRRIVAKQGYGLDILVNDPDWRVRIEVAKQGYGLEQLVNDPNWHVRCAVAEQGYGLDILANDRNEDVKITVSFMLSEYNKVPEVKPRQTILQKALDLFKSIRN